MDKIMPIQLIDHSHESEISRGSGPQKCFKCFKGGDLFLFCEILIPCYMKCCFWHIGCCDHIPATKCRKYICRSFFVCAYIGVLEWSRKSCSRQLEMFP